MRIPSLNLRANDEPSDPNIPIPVWNKWFMINAIQRVYIFKHKISPYIVEHICPEIFNVYKYVFKNDWNTWFNILVGAIQPI